MKRKLVIFWIFKLYHIFDHISIKQTRNINNLITFKEKNSVLLTLTWVHIADRQQADTKIIQNIIIKKKCTSKI